MSASELCLSYRPEDERHGQLDAKMVSGGFSGMGSAWFDREYLKNKFVNALREFPLSATNLPLLEGGFWSKEKAGTLDQCHLRVAIRPYSARGSLLVQVDLASESWNSADQDRQQTATARFIVEYAALEKFASDIEQLLRGNLAQAILSGE